MFQKLCGYREDRVAIQQAARKYGSLAQVVSGMLGGEQKDVFLWRPLLQVKPTWRQGAQALGDCTSWGLGEVLTELMAIQDRAGISKFVAEAATESIYGGARVECAGNRPGSNKPGGMQDGSVPSWAATFVKEYGVVLRLDYSQETRNPEHDMRIYDGKKAKQWGNFGCGGGKDGGLMDGIAKEHPVAYIAQVKTIAEAIASLTNGYPFTIGSGAGFGQMKRDENGICRWVDTWQHQMRVWGLRWRNGRPEFRIGQSWGDSCSGPDPGILETITDIWRPDPRAVSMAHAGQPLFVRPRLPWEGFPVMADMRAEAWNPISSCSWWCIEQDMARILSTGDCWTYSDIQGFQKRDLDILKAAQSWVTG